MPRHPSILRLHALRADRRKTATVTMAVRQIEADVGEPLLSRIVVGLHLGMISIVGDASQRSLRHELLDGGHPVDLAQVRWLGRLFDDGRLSTARG